MNSDVEHDITGARLLESILRSPIASVISARACRTTPWWR